MNNPESKKKAMIAMMAAKMVPFDFQAEQLKMHCEKYLADPSQENKTELAASALMISTCFAAENKSVEELFNMMK